MTKRKASEIEHVYRLHHRLCSATPLDWVAVMYEIALVGRTDGYITPKSSGSKIDDGVLTLK